MRVGAVVLVRYVSSSKISCPRLLFLHAFGLRGHWRLYILVFSRHHGPHLWRQPLVYVNASGESPSPSASVITRATNVVDRSKANTLRSQSSARVDGRARHAQLIGHVSGLVGNGRQIGSIVMPRGPGIPQYVILLCVPLLFQNKPYVNMSNVLLDQDQAVSSS